MVIFFNATALELRNTRAANDNELEEIQRRMFSDFDCSRDVFVRSHMCVFTVF